jgi:hypothetical protein
MPMQFSSLHNHFIRMQRQVLVIYDIEEGVFIDVIAGYKSDLLFRDQDRLDLDILRAKIDPLRLPLRLNRVGKVNDTIDQSVRLPKVGPIHFLNWNRLSFVWLDPSYEDWDVKKSRLVDYLILSDDVDVDLTKLREDFKFTQLIISANCSWKYAREIATKCRDLNLAVHNMKEDGYWLLAL